MSRGFKYGLELSSKSQQQPKSGLGRRPADSSVTLLEGRYQLNITMDASADDYSTNIERLNPGHTPSKSDNNARGSTFTGSTTEDKTNIS